MNTKIFAADPGFGDTKVNVDGRSASMASAIARVKQIGMAGIGMKTASQALTIEMNWEKYAIGDGAWHWATSSPIEITLRSHRPNVVPWYSVHCRRFSTRARTNSRQW